MTSLTRILAPDIPPGDAPPALPHDAYLERIAQTQSRFAGLGIDALVVYGDREVFGNLYFLTGTDPRFEEAVYVLGMSGRGTLLLGNENLNQWPGRELGIETRLYQALSPAGQIRTSGVKLADLLRDAGLEPGMTVGVAGNKRLGADFIDDPDDALTAPAYLVDTIRQIVGSTGSATNSDDLFTSPVDGLRTTSSAHQIALFEYGAAIASRSVLHALRALEVGVRADDLANSLFDRGIPHSCHDMINFGALQGLHSPGPNTAKLGDAATIAQGLRGGLTARAGAIAASADDLQGPARDLFPALAFNYFDVVATWHETVAVGTTAGEVFAAVDEVREVFDFFLNPGHVLHLEEWSHSPFGLGDPTVLRSGTMLQCDVIPVVGVPNVFVNIEDGVALADAGLRDELADDFPGLWDRVQRRREFLSETIGVRLDESVLPMSSIPLWHTPYLLDRESALTR